MKNAITIYSAMLKEGQAQQKAAFYRMQAATTAEALTKAERAHAEAAAMIAEAVNYFDRIGIDYKTI